jgi:hypothetical protein
MDFIVALPPTTDSDGKTYDAIAVFVDRLKKMVHLAPTTSTVDAQGTARLFVHNVFRLHGAPDNIVTDRGSVFTGTFFSAVMQALRTEHKRSTAYHPQTDGQTERVNRVLEDMLRHYVQSLGQLNWVDLLPMAEFAINNAYHTSTGSTPFRLNNGRDPQLPIIIKPAQVPSAAEWMAALEKGQCEARRCMQAAQQRQKGYYDDGRRDVRFAVGEEVLLNAKNLRLKLDGVSCSKFLPKYVGPFPIHRVVREGAAYELKLLAHMKVHPVFHVSLLRPFRRDPIPGRVQPPPPPTLCEEDGQPYYEIETIVSHRDTAGKRLCLVAWKGYGPAHNSWEPFEYLAESTAYLTYCQKAGIPPVPPVVPTKRKGG